MGVVVIYCTVLSLVTVQVFTVVPYTYIVFTGLRECDTFSEVEVRDGLFQTVPNIHLPLYALGVWFVYQCLEELIDNILLVSVTLEHPDSFVQCQNKIHQLRYIRYIYIF